MIMFKYALKRGFVSPIALILNCALPLFLLIATRNNDDSGGQVLFLIAMAIMFGGFFMAKGIQNDRMEGVLLRILAGPVTMRDYLVQNLLGAAVPMVGISVVIGVLGMILHSWTLTFTTGIVVCYAFLAITSIGLSFVWSSLFRNKESSSAAFTAVATLISFIGGLVLPLSILPDPLFYLGALFPTHWAARALQVMIDYGRFTQMYGLSILAMALFAIAFILLGAKRRLI